MRVLSVAMWVVALGVAGCGDDDGGGDPDAGVGVDTGPGVDAGPTPEVDAGPIPEVDAGPEPDAGPRGNPLDGIGAVELVDDGYVFTEGPQWIPADEVLLFSDIPANTIYRLDPAAGDAIDVFRPDSGNSNGLGIDPLGRLLAAEHGNRRVSRTEADGEIVAVCEEFMLMRFNSPNDLIARSDGTIYFTDPPYGLEGRMRELPYNGVFRADPTDRCHVEVMGSLDARPNGVVLSPDESILYVADTEACVVRAYDVAAAGGALSGERTFATDVCGADGMAMDTAENLWVTTGAGIQVFAPDGTRWGTVAVPLTPANAAFGDPDARTLYITARQALYRVRVTIPGLY